jgi:Trk-type K+ transport system membrane component
MEAPWKGEKVTPFIRILAIIFIICGLFAFCSLLYAFFERGNVSSDNLDFRSLFGMLSAPYCFLLFLKVAVTGHAPKSWIPWK